MFKHKRNLIYSVIIMSIFPSICLADKNYGKLTASSCSGAGATAICTAVGYRLLNDKKYPYIVQSFDGGQTYTDNIVGLPIEEGNLLSVECHGAKDITLCVAVGYLGEDETHAKPFVLQTDLGAHRWKTKEVSLVEAGLINKISCIDEGSYMKCYAVGWTNNSQKTIPLMLESRIGLKTWYKTKMTNMPEAGKIQSVSCAGNINNFFCAAVGNDDQQKKPIVMATNLINKQWEIQAVENANFDSTSQLLDVNCNNLLTCNAVGYKGKAPNHTALMLYFDGYPWRKVTYTPPLSESSKFTTTTCLIGTENPACIAGGYMKIQDTTYGLLFGSDTIPESIIREVSFKHVTCTPLNTFCIAVGGEDKPYLMQSDNQGINWTEKLIGRNVDHGTLLASTCTGEDQDAVCLAVGYQNQELDQYSKPLLVQSKKSGTVWETIEINNHE